MALTFIIMFTLWTENRFY